MKTNPINNYDNSCTPWSGVVHNTSPQRGASQPSLRGTPILHMILYHIRKCLLINDLQNLLHIRYIPSFVKVFAKFGFLHIYVFALVFGLIPPSSYAAIASWYSTECCKFNKSPDCPTASGKSLYKLEKDHERFAASYAYPLGTRVKVTNLSNNKHTVVRIWDRGPNRRLNREIDLCKECFKEIADLKDGIINVSVEVAS